MSLVTLQEAAAQHLCLFGGVDVFCREPAVMHVFWDDSMTMCCGKHAHWWDGRFREDDHPIGTDCGMPGTHWFGSTPEAPGTCRLILDGDPDGAE